MRLAVPLALVALGAILALKSWPRVISGYSNVPPFHYSNANAAFFVQTAIAALMLAFGGRRGWLTLLGIAAAIPYAAIPLLTNVKAGVILLALLLLRKGELLQAHGLDPSACAAERRDARAVGRESGQPDPQGLDMSR